MKVIEIAFTGYPVTNLKRARQFYEGTLGLTAARTGGDETSGWIEYDIGPGTLSIGNVAPEWKPSPGGGCAALETVDGIGPKRRKRIKEAWAEQKVIREIMVFLHSHGVSTSRAVRIYKTACKPN